jgi:dipeptidyl aminopeptidase/acylaminoacyl peptidase
MTSFPLPPCHPVTPEDNHVTHLPRVAPYGAWRSPITTELITGKRVGVAIPRIVDGATYWIESRSQEGGRSVIVRRAADGTIADVIPPGFDNRSRVHEYGGSAFAVRDGTVYFSNFFDSRLYRLDEGAAPRPITPEGAWRYADLIIDPERGRLIAMREDHSQGGEPVNTIVAVDLAGDERGGTVLASGADFNANPRLSPDGRQLAWLQWNHPNMPWDASELWVGEAAPDGSIARARRVVGGGDESIFQPEWAPDGTLYFVSDRSGWWNLYRRRDGRDEAVAPMEAEFGVPQWTFGMTTYAFPDAETIVATYTQDGLWRMILIDVASGKITPVETEYTTLDDPVAGDGAVVLTAASATQPPAVVRFDPHSRQFETVKRSIEVDLDPGYLSVPTPIAFPTEGGLTAHVFLYLPANKDFVAPEGELPPLLVQSHGGPTGANSSALSLSIQFWTSRGFAVLEVDYGGSTGYGRAYRQRLDDRWGIVDVDDCVNGARYLIEQGLVDANRVAIRGWSASGYTTLAALGFRDFFQAGASHFGISDLETMTTDTHKFESRYLDRLIGPYPERRDTYVERSPIHHLEQFTEPLMLFQGSVDKIVPPDQAQTMYEAMAARGLAVGLQVFAGEGHGFRRAENIRAALELELDFYGQIFGFTPAGEIARARIANLSG